MTDDIFAPYLALVDFVLERGSDIVGTIEARLLNVRGKPLEQLRDRRTFDRIFTECVFAPSNLPVALRGLGGRLEARHVADGFEPAATGPYVPDVDPVELIVRAYEHWNATRWPGSSGRRAYAGTLLALWLRKRLGHLTLRAWDAGSADAAGRLDELQQRLDRVAAAFPDDVTVRDTRWLLQTTLGPFTRGLEPYLRVFDRVEGTLPGEVRREIHLAGAVLAGGHLRSQLQYRSADTGRPIGDVEHLAITRNSNSLDFALLIGDLVPLLDAYLAAGTDADEVRLPLADAILQGLSADPDLLLQRWDLLVPSTMIETAFITHGDGRARYSALGERHVGHLGRYRALMAEAAPALREDAEALAPEPAAYSPYGISYGFVTDVLANMAMSRLAGRPSRGVSLEDLFASRRRSADLLACARDWQTLPRRPGEREHFSHADEWTASVYARLVAALERRMAGRDAANASTVLDARLVFVGGRDDHAKPIGAANADMFCLVGTGTSPPVSGSKTSCPTKELLDDRSEARLVASAEVNGQWWGLSKALLTLVLGQGADAMLSEVPDEVVDVTKLTCPGLVADDRPPVTPQTATDAPGP